MIEKLKRIKKDEGKEAELPDDTPPVYMEEGVTDINDDNNGKNGDIKRQND